MPKASPKERIMQTTLDLFYRQGYRATGINQIIQESGVAKASFYDHFPSKEILFKEYLQTLVDMEYREMSKSIQKEKTPRERFFAIIRMIKPWFLQTDFRGCPFQNALGEASCGDDIVSEASQRHRNNIRCLLEEVSRELIDSDPKLAGKNAQEIVDTYMLLMEGAIILSVTYRDLWPVEQAERTLEKILFG